MSAIPAFEIGVWNAWILTLVVMLSVMSSGKVARGAGDRISHIEEEKKARTYMMLVFFILLIYSVFLPLETGTVWLYVGLVVYIMGLVIPIIAVTNVAATKPDEPFTTGAYRYSRHPISLGMFLAFLGIGIATASWLYMLLSVILLVISHFMVVIEERFCLEKYGDSYREYMNRTPRWIGIPK